MQSFLIPFRVTVAHTKMFYALANCFSRRKDIKGKMFFKQKCAVGNWLRQGLFVQFLNDFVPVVIPGFGQILTVINIDITMH